jgi:antitoxin component YwqK of YwqJK toxin-antitoxin module
MNDPTSLVAIQIQDRNGLIETISTEERLARFSNIDFLKSQPYKKVSRMYRKEGKNCALITTYHPNGLLAQYLETEDMRAHGAYQEWYSNGQLKIQTKVIGGTADVTLGAQKDWLFEGLSQVWDEQGHLVAKIPYVQGMIEGNCLYFYPEGTLQRKISYDNNMIEGEETNYFPNGSIESRFTYKKGIRQGKASGFFTNGKPAWTEEYTEGLLLNGVYYQMDGITVAEVKEGRGQQAKYEKDTLRYLIEIKRGSAEGLIQIFSSSQELQGFYHLKNGKKQGEEREYFLASESDQKEFPKLSIQWDQNKIHGLAKTWYPNGQLQSQREYSQNQKSGPFCAWYNNGALMFIEEYEKDLIVKGAYYKKNYKDPISTIANGSGTAYFYDENGVFLKKVVYSKGTPLEEED